MIKLEDFITSTLKEVINGIKGAQKHAEECGGAINPIGLQYLVGSSGTVQHKETSRVGTEVEFEIEVIVTEQKGSNGKFSVSIPTVVEAGIGGQSGTENRSLNKIKFKVPVIFPKGEYSEKKAI